MCTASHRSNHCTKFSMVFVLPIILPISCGAYFVVNNLLVILVVRRYVSFFSSVGISRC